MAQQADFLLAPTHYSEIRAQLELGQKLTVALVVSFGDSRASFQGQWSDPDQARRNLEEAVRAYQAVLVLDPENHEAKMRMASCFQSPILGKLAEACDLVREVADSSIEDRWRLQAMLALGQYYRNDDPAQAVEWYKRASEYSKKHPSSPSFYRGTNEPAEYLRIAGQITAEIQAIGKTAHASRNYPESLLFDGARKMESFYLQPNSFVGDQREIGMAPFMNSFGTNRGLAVSRLNELLPDLQKEFPDLAPDLLAIALTYQLDTNSAVVSNFVRSIERYSEHPDEVLVKSHYFWRLSRECYQWCMGQKMYALAIRLVEIKQRVQMRNGGIDSSFGLNAGIIDSAPVLTNAPQIILEDNMRLVYAYMASERWQVALDLLKNAPDEPFLFGVVGPWGRAVIPNELIAQCQEKLGLPVKKDPRLFQLGKPWWSFGDPGVFTTDQSSLWIAVGSKLWQVSFDTKTKTEINLPKNPGSPITALYNEPSKLWIGTIGDGLIEYDKESHKSRRFTDKDGLLVNNIFTLCPQGDVVWIGFDGSAAEGLGRLDLRTGRATTFTRSLDPQLQGSNQPPPGGVAGIFAGRSNDLLIYVGWHFFRYHIAENSWEPLPWTPLAKSPDSQRLVLQSEKGLGLAVENLAREELEKISPFTGPPGLDMTTLALDGNDLWVAGMGFIGVGDLHEHTARKLCYIQSQRVDHIEVAGNYVWIMMDRCLYRIPLSETR